MILLVRARINMFFVKKSNYLDRDNGEAFESKECVGLSEHVGEKHCSFHDYHVSVVFIDLSVHDLYTSIVAHYVLKIVFRHIGLCSLRASKRLFHNIASLQTLASLNSKVY